LGLLEGVHAAADGHRELLGRSSARAGDRVRRPLMAGGAVSTESPTARVKLVWFVPPAALSSTRDAVFAAGAGWIGDYSRCSWVAMGEGTFFGGEATSPAVGEPGRDQRVAE